MKDALDQVLGVVIATIVAIVLRWAAVRWPMQGEDGYRPKRRRRDSRPPDDDPLPEED